MITPFKRLRFLTVFLFYFLVCQGQYDLAFLIDSSSEVGEKNFDLAKQFIVDIVDAFDVNIPQTHIAVISYDSTPKVEITFNKYPRVDKDRIKAAIRSLSYRGKGPSSTSAALQQVIDVVYNPANGARDGVNKVSIFCLAVPCLHLQIQLIHPFWMSIRKLINTVFSVSSNSQSRKVQ